MTSRCGVWNDGHCTIADKIPDYHATEGKRITECQGNTAQCYVAVRDNQTKIVYRTTHDQHILDDAGTPLPLVESSLVDRWHRLTDLTIRQSD